MSKEKQAVLKIAGVFISTVIGRVLRPDRRSSHFLFDMGGAASLGLALPACYSFYMVGGFYPAYIKISSSHIQNSPIKLQGGRRAAC